jgi:hypothetical protein
MANLLHSIRHWFTPGSTNNYRAHLLKNTSLVLAIGFLIGLNGLIRIVEISPLNILGFSSSITIDEVVAATNRQRITEGLSPLQYSEVLSDAARRKAANMFEENYWAHNSPSGKSPWVWFNQAGYKYIHAGENLAKDFGNTDNMLSAWMDSPTHRANIVSDKYQEIGIAVVPGTLQGQETVLVVQLFGARGQSAGTVTTPQTPRVRGDNTAYAEVPEILEVSPTEVTISTPVTGQAPFSFGRYSDHNLKQLISAGFAILFFIALVLDLFIAERSSLSRRVGKNWGHIVVINIVLLLVAIAHAGNIL